MTRNDRKWGLANESKYQARATRPLCPDYVSDQSYTVHSDIPLRYRTTSPAIRFFSWLLA